MCPASKPSRIISSGSSQSPARSSKLRREGNPMRSRQRATGSRLAAAMRIRRLALTLCLLALPAGGGAAGAEPQWLTLPPTPSLPKPQQSGYAPVNGIGIWYATFGRGEPVLLLHGGLANANYWGNQVPALAKNYRVIVMDS